MGNDIKCKSSNLTRLAKLVHSWGRECLERETQQNKTNKFVQVSWIRTKDLHILTSGTLTFSADSRFESVHSNSRDFWGLRIRGARIADTGQYECQVNTDPKMSFAINLTVTGELSLRNNLFYPSLRLRRNFNAS